MLDALPNDELRLYRAWVLFIEDLAEPEPAAAPARAHPRSLCRAAMRSLERVLATVSARLPARNVGTADRLSA
jgi:hypothetical protein